MSFSTTAKNGLNPNPATVSSTSSLDTAGNIDLGLDTTGNGSIVNPISSSPLRRISDHQHADTNATTTSHVTPNPAAANTSSMVPIEPMLSSSSTVPVLGQNSQLRITPMTSIVVPSAMPNTNTVPEFLYQLTKMLTDNNRGIIEWSNGKIEVHNPHKLQTHVLNRYFRHSKFASFQRQLNYFGFRKLAGKGKMAPCSYVNEATTQELGSLLLIKRKTGNEPKAKAGKKRDRDEHISVNEGVVATQEDTSSSVNPVLAGILYRNATATPSTAPTSSTSNDHQSFQAHQSTARMQPGQSQQALAKVAVGKGIRHGFSASMTLPRARPTTISAATPNPLAAAASPPPAPSAPVQDGLSALTSNFKSSMEDANKESATNPMQAEAPESIQSISSDPIATSSLLNAGYVPGSMSRDDSLVDLAMIPEVNGTETSEEPHDMSAGLTFVDFPWHDPTDSIFDWGTSTS